VELVTARGRFERMDEQPAGQRVAGRHKPRDRLEIAARLFLIPGRRTRRQRLEKPDAPLTGVADDAAVKPGRLSRKTGWTRASKYSKSRTAVADDAGCCVNSAVRAQSRITASPPFSTRARR
jgi:hypothetical protein